jgi:DNA ligase-1
VFDLVKMDVGFRDRLFDLQAYAAERFQFNGKVFAVGYVTAYSKEELRALHKDAVERGYEGVMIRTHDGIYESGKRSSGLYKYKELMDGEFQILDIIPDKQGNAVFVLQNNRNGEVFTCVMGDMEQRAFYLANKHLFIGKWLKVQYQSRYKKTLLPQFPTGIMVRECDEQGNPIE